MKDRGKQKGLKVVMLMMGICVVGYIVGPPLYWHLSDIIVVTLRSFIIFLLPWMPVPDDCMRDDPEVSEEMEKSFTGLLSEEVRLKEAEALIEQQRADVSLLEAKKMASQHQKDADKCNAGMETCEEARESAESTLEAQKKLSAMWELRARQDGTATSLLLK